MEAVRVEAQSAVATVETLPGGVALVTHRGAVSMCGWRAARAEVRRRPVSSRLAVVVDYRHCIIALTPEEIGLELAEDRAAGRLVWPSASVVPAHCVAAWQSAAGDAAAVGVLRRVFSDLGTAVQWAREEAAAHRGQIPPAAELL